MKSAVLFGSVPRGEAVAGVSDVNVLVLVESIGAARLQTAAPVIQHWIRAGNTPPHFYSVSEWEGMRDTFAIEMADMQDAREVLHGVDPVPAEAVLPSDLRLHAEREMRETLLHLRLRMLLGANDPMELGRLLLSGLPSFTAYMRAALRLSGREPGLDSREVIEQAGVLIGADPMPLLVCWDARNERKGMAVPITDPLIEGYTDFTRELVDYLDRLSAIMARLSAGSGRPAETAAPRGFDR